MISASSGAALGELVQLAADMFQAAPGNLAPDPDPRLAPDWRLLGHLVGRDVLFGSGARGLGQDVCYGFLLEATAMPGNHVAVVRGTGTFLEALLDTEFMPRSHPVVGRVEDGFWRVYTDLRYAPLGGAQVPVAAGIAAALGPTDTVCVVGHSLGAAVATYAAFDLAGILGERVSACLLASPQPGDGAFCKAFDDLLPERYALWNYVFDAVPRVPYGPDYSTLPRATWINPKTAQARIGLSVLCHHHVLDYVAMMDYSRVARWIGWAIPLDITELACIKGPAGVFAKRPG